MSEFMAIINKDGAGRLTYMEIPFDVRKEFGIPKGTIYVNGTINEIPYRNKLLSRGKGKFIMLLDKEMRGLLKFHGSPLEAKVKMYPDNIIIGKDESRMENGVNNIVDNIQLGVDTDESGDSNDFIGSNMDVITAITTRKSIRKYTEEALSDQEIKTILNAGFCAPSATNKRPWHFIVLRDKAVFAEMSELNPYVGLLKQTDTVIVICGDAVKQGIKELLYEDCSAAVQNMLLCIHGIGLGGVWCGVVSNQKLYKYITAKLKLPKKMVPVALISVGHPAEKRTIMPRYEEDKVHYNSW